MSDNESLRPTGISPISPTSSTLLWSKDELSQKPGKQTTTTAERLQRLFETHVYVPLSHIPLRCLRANALTSMAGVDN